MITYKAKPCKVCGVSFQPGGPNVKGCSDACRAELARRREKKRNQKPERRAYVNAHKLAWYHASPENKAKHNAYGKTADKARAEKARRERVKVCACLVCKVCQSVFWVVMEPGATPPVTCSDKCKKARKAARTRATTARRRALGVCVRCGGERNRSGTLCRVCCETVTSMAGLWSQFHRAKRLDPAIPREKIDWRLVWARDGGRCQICGKACPKSRRGTKHANAPVMDHRVPVSKGGPSTYENIQLVCRACNARKSNTNELGQLPLLWARPPGVASYGAYPAVDRALGAIQ